MTTSIAHRVTWAAAAALGLALASPAALAQKVKFATSLGDFVVEVDAAKAPATVANFMQYVKDGHYDGTVFHRVIPGFMVQGGGMTPDLAEKKTRAPIPLETSGGLKNVRGSVAMARTMDPASATAQFFVNVVDNDFLNADRARDGYGYAVFGKVTSGMDVVDRIVAVPTGNQGRFQNVPETPVIIKKASVEK